MDEQRISEYLNLINQLLSCNQGDESQILQENQGLLDQGLVTELLKVSDSLRQQSDLNNTNRLMNIAGNLLKIYSSSYLKIETTYLKFLMQVLQKVTDDSKPHSIYPFLSQNLDKLDDNLITVLDKWARNKLSSVDKEQSYSIAKIIFDFSNLIAQFPLGNITINKEIAVIGYNITLTVFTFEAFPQDWAMTQNNLAIAYRNRIRGDKAENLEKAIAYYQEALKVRTLEVFPQDWAMTQNNLANAYRNRIRGNKAENLDKAIIYYQEALKVYTSDVYPYEWAMTRNNLANAYCEKLGVNKAENLEKAIIYYQEALEVRTFDVYPYEWAMTRNNLATAYLERIRGDKAENLELAIAHFNEALKVRTFDVYPYEWANTKKNLATAYVCRVRGDKAENLELAITAYTEALKLLTFEAFPQDWAITQNDLANTYLDRIRGDKAENLELAITAYTEALKLLTFEAFPQYWAMTHNHLANAYLYRIRESKAENLERAIVYYQEALNVYTVNDFPIEWADTQNNLAVTYRYRIRGDKAENLERAIAYYQKALNVYTVSDFPIEWARTQNNLATAYLCRIRGDKAENLELAISACTEALKVRTLKAFPQDWAMTQNNLGEAYRNRIRGDEAKNLELAITAHREALKVRTLEAFPQDWAMTQNNLAIAYSVRIRGEKADNIELAITAYTEALKVRTLEAFPQDWAMTQNNLAIAYSVRIRGENAENIKTATKYYHNALKIFTQEDDPLNCLQTARNLGKLHYNNKQWQPAIKAYHLAIEALENARLEALNLQRRQEILSNTIDIFHRIVRVHLNLNQPEKALEYIERSKARNLVELITQKNFKPQGVTQDTIDKLNQLRQQVVNEKIRLQHQSIYQNLIRNDILSPYVQEQSYLKKYQQELDDFIKDKITPFDSIFNLNQKVQSISFDDIQSLIDKSTCLLQWYITSEKILAFVVSANEDIKYWESSETDFQAFIEAIRNYGQLYNSYRNRENIRWKEQLSILLQTFTHTLHINDILGLIPNICQRLIIIPHLYLHILPLHALPIDDNRILQDKYDIQYAPSCQLLKIIQQRLLNELSSLFAIKNPTKDLIYTELEVNIISALFNDKIIIPQDEATKDTVTTHPKLSDSHCHHFSCHGIFNFQNPLESALLLANKEDLRLGEIFELNLKKSRLVVLSACETGLIDLNSLSDEYIGLPSGFLFAGSPSVVSSLWTVNDLSTSFLMMKFYEILPKNPNKGEIAICLKKAQNWLRNLTIEAFDLELEKMKPQIDDVLSQLRKGQQSIFNESLKIIRQRQPHPFKEPYYWAGFCSVGF